MNKKVILGFFLSTALLGGIWTAAKAQGPGPKQTQAPKGQGRTQEPGKHKMSAEDILKRLTERLQLREDQQKKIKDILEKSQPEMQKLEAEMKALHERMKKAMFSAKENIRETLDIDQKEQFDDISRSFMMRHERMSMPMGRPGMGGPGVWGHGGHEGGPMMEGREHGREMNQGQDSERSGRSPSREKEEGEDDD